MVYLFQYQLEAVDGKLLVGSLFKFATSGRKSLFQYETVARASGV